MIAEHHGFACLDGPQPVIGTLQEHKEVWQLYPLIMQARLWINERDGQRQVESSSKSKTEPWHYQVRVGASQSVVVPAVVNLLSGASSGVHWGSRPGEGLPRLPKAKQFTDLAT